MRRGLPAIQYRCMGARGLRREQHREEKPFLSRNDHVPRRLRLGTMDLDGSESRLPQSMSDIIGGSKGEDILRESQALHRITRQEAEREHATRLEHPPDLAGTCGQRSPEVHRVDAAHLVELIALQRQGLDLSNEKVGTPGIDRRPISRSRPRTTSCERSTAVR